MFKFQFGGTQYRISILFPAVLLWLLIRDASGICLIALSASVLHECGHVFAMFLFHKKPASLHLSFYGVRLLLPSTQLLTLGQQTIVSLAGPLVNILCGITFMLLQYSEIVVFTHVCLACINLLPILPLDGGYILDGVCRCICSPETATRFVRRCSVIVWGVFCIIAILTFYCDRSNFTLLFVSFYTGICLLFYKGN